MKKKEVLINALRCSISHDEKCDVKCPYRIEEELSEEQKDLLPPDVLKDGTAYWITCNSEKIIEDTVVYLEAIKEEENMDAIKEKARDIQGQKTLAEVGIVMTCKERIKEIDPEGYKRSIMMDCPEDYFPEAICICEPPGNLSMCEACWDQIISR